VEPWYRLAICVAKPWVVLLFRRDYRGQEHIPRSGGCVVAVNHISYADPIVAGIFVHDAGRRPRFLGKASVFRVPVTGRIIRGARQIPVYRESADAAMALSAAVAAVRGGECVVLYPEGTVTKDPDYWPMLSKTGVARIALATGAPVIPVAQWGAQHFLGRSGRPRFGLRRTRAVVLAGAPVNLDPWRDRELTAQTLRAATDAVMREVRSLLGEIRSETPPDAFYPPQSAAPDGAARSSA